MAETVAIVGAGLAGIAAARRLTAAGVDVRLFDKGRGIGGRCATRRAGGFAFDHGAQYATARGASFRTALVAAGDAAATWDAAGGNDPRWVGVPGMSALPKALAAGLAVETGRTVTALARDAAGWRLAFADGKAEGAFARLLLTAPAPQSRALLGDLASPATVAALGGVVYAPSWTLMLGFTAEPPDMAATLRPDDPRIGWIARDGTKPGRDAGAVVVQATPAWSRANLERPADEVAADLQAAFASITGVTATPLYAAAHRWRYALVERAAGQPALHEPSTGLALAGDWCLGGRVEAAWDSGEAAARLLLG